MTQYPTTEDLVAIGHVAMGGNAVIRDVGLLDSAAHRPMATAFGDDAYPELHLKAAALFHSILRNHPLVDGNKRLAWVGCRTFLAINGADFTPDENAAVEFVLKVAAGEIDDLAEMASTLRSWTGQ